MSALTPEQIRQLAHLGRIVLTEEESEHFAPQLAQILGYVEQLQAVDVEGVPEYLSSEQPDSSLRADEPGPMLGAEAMLAGVPKRRGDLVVVPKFKED